MSKEIKEFRIMFRGDQATLETMQKLGNKLGLGRGELLRFCIEDIAEKYLDFEAALIVIERSRWTGIVDMLKKMFIEKVYNHQKDLTDKFEKALQKVKGEIIEQLSENPEALKFIEKIEK